MVDTISYRKDLEQAIVQADTIKIFDDLLTIWVEEWASDIHIEPFETYSRIRIRIDGILHELIQYPRNIHDSIIAKFKIESGQMRSDEKRMPQDARVSTVTLSEKEIDLRANTLPTVWGEKLVMRIVDKSKEIPPLDVLWIEWTNNKKLFRSLNIPNGVILTTWPTGSGKSTTLYAALSYINNLDINLTTYEDPVENKIDWLNQSQVRWDIGYTFASGLRAALRQDPDIIMVWEIRDQETLDTAMEASMTWHLVFSTIHTNSAAETITRVMNMWAAPYMISWSFSLVMAQRLARKICDNCKVEFNIKEQNWEYYNNALNALKSMNQEDLKKELLERGISNEQWSKFKEGKLYKWSWKDPNTGEICPNCWGMGYKWRIWLYEMLEFTDKIKDLLFQNKSTFDIEKQALKDGMINLERDGVFKAIQWRFNLKDLYRLTKTKDYDF